MTNSRNKGKRGELLWRDILRSVGYTDARRGQQFSGGPGSPDVVGGPAGWHCEVKFRDTLNVHNAVSQALHEAPPATRPYVAWKKNNKDWLVILRAGDWLELVRALELIQKEKNDA